MNEKEYKAIMEEVRSDLQHRMDTLTSISVKAADVLKYVLTELDAFKRHADRLNSSKVVDAVEMPNLDAAVKYIGGILEDEPKGPCAGICPKGEPGPDGDDHTGSELIQKLFDGSKYAIDRGEMSAYRRSNLDTDDGLAYEFVASVEQRNETATYVYHESFIAFLYASFAKTVRLFDEKVASLKGIQFLTKEENARNLKERKEAVEYYKKAEPVVRDLIKEKVDVTKESIDERIGRKCPGKCGKCKCHKDKAVDKFVKVLTSKKALEGFKQFLLKSSKHEIPSTRLQVLFDRTDRKSQKFVYELRFFQRSYRKDETQSYESVPLRVRMDGDSGDLIAKRFDKAVSELRFNEFTEKK